MRLILCVNDIIRMNTLVLVKSKGDIVGDIILKREYEEADSLAKYNICVNGEIVNTIENGSRKVISLKPGTYDISISYRKSKAEIKQIEIKKNQTLRLSCGSNLTGLKLAFSWFFILGKNNLYLKETKV